jgi:hypothetical protein
MTARLRSLVVPAVAVAAIAAPAATAAPEAIVVRIVDTPTFAEPTEACPHARGFAPLRSPGGAIIGRVENCILTDEFSCTPRSCSRVDTARETYFLRDGAIETRVLRVYRFNSDFSQALFSITGSIVRGTGRYAGASGVLVGGGVIRFDPDFTPHPSITEVLLLD